MTLIGVNKKTSSSKFFFFLAVFLKMLHVDVATMLQGAGAPRTDHQYWTADVREISDKCHPQPEIQHYHFSTDG